jgi:ADP-heptose:LPS heptosyltransferase
VEPSAAPIVAGNPHLNDVIVAPRGGWRAECALIRRLRRNRYDLAIDFHGGPRASILTYFSGARDRIGYRVAGRSWLYTRVVDRPRALRPRHSVVNQWDLLEPLGIPPPDPSTAPAEMAIEPAAAARVGDRLLRDGAGAGALIVVHVSAGNPFRRWPIDHFTALVAALVAGRGDRRVIVTAGPSDHQAAARVIAGARARVADAASRILAGDDLSLGELRALVERAQLFVGGDSGPLHVASTSRVPIVGLYGPTLPARSAPWRDARIPAVAVGIEDLPCRPCDQRVCAPGDFRCLTQLPPARVIEAAEQLLHPL